ncbi:integrase arm-type DNA-binding domain-containing protein [Pseudohaliea sp.]|uniref:tyrosine-type recombinase/integrase n=1 Tax=Pseudohaliea sp. TaxID=2740289 RepID=UPI0032EE714A
MERFRLKANQIGTARPPGLVADGGGLYLSTSKTGSQSWVYRFRRNGKLIDRGMGSVEDLSLKEARELADECRKAARRGEDPRAVIRGKDGGVTFREAAKQYIEAQAPAWRSPKQKPQWESSLKTYADKFIGDMSVDKITTDDVLRVLQPIWYTKTETASRVRMRIEAILAWATVHGHREGFNPAIWKGHLDLILPPREKVQKRQHFNAIDYKALPELYSSLGESVSAQALRFTILTCCRTHSVIGARWEEFDEDVWTVPGERMKSGKPFRVPLSPPALAIMEKLNHGQEWVFPGLKRGKPLSNMAMLTFLQKKRPGVTVHGMRSAFRDWAAEETSHPNEVCEMALSHVIRNAVEAAYRRGDLLAKRRVLMNEWAEFVEGA